MLTTTPFVGCEFGQTRTNKGFTLLELIFCLLISALLILLTIASVQELIMAQRVFYYTHQLQSFIELARQQALAQAEPVELCSRHDQQPCELFAAGHSWSEPLVIQASGRVLQSLAAIPKPLRLYWVANSLHRERLRFLPNGFSQADQGAFYVCPPAAYFSLARALIVLRSGRLRVSGDYSKLPAICAVGK